MTIKSVITEVCSFVGVRPPQGSVIQPPLVGRTEWEFVSLANEMAQRIAYDTRDWTELIIGAPLFGTDAPEYEDFGGASFAILPADFKRLLLTSNVRRRSTIPAVMRFVPDFDEWFSRFVSNTVDSRGEWTRQSGRIYTRPKLAVDDYIHINYLDKNCVRLVGGGFGDRFLSDDDEFRLDERLLKLAMIWQWKATKGASYAEDLANYEDALSRVAGADKPSPTIIGMQAISTYGEFAYGGPVPPGGTFVGPGP